MKELIFEYTSIISSILLLVYYTNQMISLFESKEYRFKNTIEILKIYLCRWYNYFPFILIPFIFFIDIWMVGIIYSLAAILFFIFLRSMHKNVINNYWKALGLYVIVLIIETIIGTIILFNIKLVELTSLLIIILNINFLFVYLGYLIMYPAEKLLDKIKNK